MDKLADDLSQFSLFIKKTTKIKHKVNVKHPGNNQNHITCFFFIKSEHRAPQCNQNPNKNIQSIRCENIGHPETACLSRQDPSKPTKSQNKREETGINVSIDRQRPEDIVVTA